MKKIEIDVIKIPRYIDAGKLNDKGDMQVTTRSVQADGHFWKLIGISPEVNGDKVYHKSLINGSRISIPLLPHELQPNTLMETTTKSYMVAYHRNTLKPALMLSNNNKVPGEYHVRERMQASILTVGLYGKDLLSVKGSVYNGTVVVKKDVIKGKRVDLIVGHLPSSNEPYITIETFHLSKHIEGIITQYRVNLKSGTYVKREKITTNPFRHPNIERIWTYVPLVVTFGLMIRQDQIGLLPSKFKHKATMGVIKPKQNSTTITDDGIYQAARRIRKKYGSDSIITVFVNNINRIEGDAIAEKMIRASFGTNKVAILLDRHGRLKHIRR